MKLTWLARRRRTARSERGSASIEMAILAPAVLAMYGMVFIGGQINLINQATEAAAFDGARSASLARDKGSAVSQGTAAARSRLQAQGVDCTESAPPVNVNTGGFDVPVGTPAQVTVTVTCTVDYSDFSPLFLLTPVGWLNAGHTTTAQFTSPLDTYRGRS